MLLVCTKSVTIKHSYHLSLTWILHIKLEYGFIFLNLDSYWFILIMMKFYFILYYSSFLKNENTFSKLSKRLFLHGFFTWLNYVINCKLNQIHCHFSIIYFLFILFLTHFSWYFVRFYTLQIQLLKLKILFAL